MNELWKTGGRRWRGWRAIAVIMTAALGLPSVAWAQEQKLPTAEKVLDKTIDAQGGREAFEKLQSRVSKATLQISVGPQTRKGTYVRYEAAPDLRLVEIKLGPQTIASGTDGFVHWSLQQPGKTEILEGAERDASARRSRFNAQLHWRDLYDKVECVGKEEFAGRPCVKVILTPKVGEPLTCYYDWANGLPLGTEEVRKNPEGERQVREQFEDYRDVDGVKLPFRVRRTVTEGGQTQTLVYTYESIEHNTAPADRFALPEAVKKLREKPVENP